MYVIVVGAGEIGAPLIDIAIQNGEEVVAIERDPERADEIADDFDCLVLNADGTVKETLEDAGAERADAIVATTDQDATNVMVSLLAQEFGVPEILSVVRNPEHMPLFERIGVHTMQNPQRLIARDLFRSLRLPSVEDYMRIGEEAEVFEITVDEGAPIAGKTLQGASEADLLGADVLIVAIERNGNGSPITPRGPTRIEPGDLVTVYSGSGATPELTDVFGHPEDHF
ncbi:Trk potassium uptake system protein [Salinarchaeum sp. Harcht-Bsk1]|uniref:potassium channel family protein n=1 Tax=Salinarchaeum sp. Harcht-Bsk1 TaxID=1333523 RepID=UPI000342384E|nr:TrkA family potassium uptake protein [Salinarchaeum sp. Harcht-Bsk1]AGN02481.1 Trk potassium uptake system protein [Salinarchaeum sp. Harcht-Bsk1]